MHGYFNVLLLMHSKLLEMYMFNIMRKRGSCKHIMGMHYSFVVATCVNTH